MTGRDPSKDKPKKPKAALLGGVTVEPAGPKSEWSDDTVIADHGMEDPASFPLPNPKQEAFAQNLAIGQPVHEAYINAGYTGNPANARRLRSDEAVWKRVKWLQAEIGKRAIEKAAEENTRHIKAINYDREEAFKEAGLAMGMALAMGQSGAAVAAVKLRAEIAGLTLGEKPEELDKTAEAAKSVADPRVVDAIAGVKRARLHLVASGGKKAE